MAERQLTLDGREVEHPVRFGTPLSERQREILRFIRSRREVRSYEVGAMMHAGREAGCTKRFPDDGVKRLPCCPYASADGTDVLNRLRNRGLVERIGWGRWRALPDGRKPDALLGHARRP